MVPCSQHCTRLTLLLHRGVVFLLSSLRLLPSANIRVCYKTSHSPDFLSAFNLILSKLLRFFHPTTKTLLDEY